MRLSDLIPVKGKISKWEEAIRKVRTPYIQITKEQYDTLLAGEYDFYLYKGELYTFGGASDRFVLMPYGPKGTVTP